MFKLITFRNCSVIIEPENMKTDFWLFILRGGLFQFLQCRKSKTHGSMVAAGASVLPADIPINN